MSGQANKKLQLDAMRGPVTKNRDVIMPRYLTPEMRKAAEHVPPSITIADEPFLDKLWAALYEAAQR